MDSLLHRLLDLGPLASLLLRLTILLTGAWAAHALLRARNPRWRVLFWRGALAGAAALPLLTLAARIELPVWVEPPSIPASPAPPLMFAASYSAFPDSSAEPPAASAPDAMLGLPEPPPPPPFSLRVWSRDHRAGLLWGLWAAVAAALLGRVAAGAFCMRRLIRAAAPAPFPLQARLEVLAREMDCRRPVALRLSASLSTPLLTGLRRPVILLPERMARPAYAGWLPAVLAHEIGHLRTGDLAWMLAARCLAALLWFHPLAWGMARAHAAACEEVSDALAAEALQDHEAYASVLAGVALEMSGAPAAAAAIAMARCPNVLRRLRRLSDRLQVLPLGRRRAAAALAAGCVALIALGSLRLVQAQPGLPPAPVIEAAKLPAGSRVLHFPRNRIYGKLMISTRPADSYTQVAGGSTRIGDRYEWEFLGEARGDLVVPAGRLALLEVQAPWLLMNPDALGGLAPDDLYQVGIHTPRNQPAPAGYLPDSVMAQVARLRGLKALDLSGWEGITPRGLQSLNTLTALECLNTPSKLTNEGLAIVAGLPSLKQLIINECEVNDLGLGYLPRLTGLEELEICGSKVTGPGVGHLPRLKSLRRLTINGFESKLDQNCYSAIARIPALEYLRAFGEQVSDQALAQLAASRTLATLDLYHDEVVTDAGVASLAKMPALKSLNLRKAGKLTNLAAEHLGRIPTLEELSLEGNNMDDRALAALARLPRLKRLGLSIAHWADPAKNTRLYTAQGLAPLADRGLLESLHIGGAGIDDAALAQIGRLTRLTDLGFFPLLTATNAGMARLGTLKNLENLEIFNESDALTIAGLNHLNALTRLRILDAHDIGQDEAGLDLSALTGLEKLFIYTRQYQSLRDEDLACLAGMTRMKWLQLTTGDRISDRGLAHLAGMTNLSMRLAVGSPAITDRGVKSLAGMQKLSELMINGKIGDAGLREIAKLRSLRYVKVTTPELFSPEGIDAIRRLPFLTEYLVSPRPIAGLPELCKVGQDAPDLTVTTLEGRKIQLSKIENKLVMLHFWATWDRASMAGLAELKKLNETMNAKFPGRFMLLSLAHDRDESVIRDAVRREGLAWPVARTGGGAGYNYGINKLPSCFLMDPAGKVLLNPESDWKDAGQAASRALQ